MGEYRLAPEFEMFSVSPVVGSQKTPEQQQELVRKALDEVCMLPSVQQAKITKRLSVTVDESRLTSVDAGMLNQIWQEAEEVLSRHEIVDLGEGVYANIPKRAGEKSKEKKKKRKRENNVKCVPIIEEVQRPDNDIDFQKPLGFTEIWHNHNDFNVVFTRGFRNAKKMRGLQS